MLLNQELLARCLFGLQAQMMPENDPKPLLRTYLSFRPQIGKVKPQRMLRHTQAQLAVWAVGGQQAPLEQRRHLRRAQPVAQAA